MKNRIIKTLVLLLCAGSAAQAQSASTMSLRDVVNYSLQDNTDIKKKNLAVLQSQQRVNEVRGQALPQINLTGQLVDNLILAKSIIPGEVFGQPGTGVAVAFGTQYSVPVSARADVLIYNQSFLTGLKQAKAGVDVALIVSDKTKQEIIYNVATAYYSVVLVGEQSNLIQANLTKVEQSVKVVQSQLDNQMARKIDLDQLKVTLANTQTDYENSRVQFSYNLDRLKILMGFPIADTLILEQNIVREPVLIPENTVTENPQIALIKGQERLKSLEIKSINAKYSPSLSGFAQYGYQAQFQKWNDQHWFPNSNIGVQLNFSIFDGLQKHQQVKQRKMEMQSIQLDEKLLENTLNAQYTNAVKKYVQNQKNVTNQEANLALAQSVYDAMQNNYRNGLASLSDLINSDTGLKDAQSKYLNSVLQLKVSSLDILYVNGNMTQLSN